MLDDLQCVVAVAKKDLKERISKRKSTYEAEPGDEDLFNCEAE